MNAHAAGDLQAIAAEWPAQGEAGGFWIAYHIGSEFYGETDARFEDNGRYVLWSTVTQGRERLEFSGRLDPDEVRGLVELVTRERLWTVRHVRPTQADDDAPAFLEAGDGVRRARVELWVSEAGSVPEFARVQEAVLDLIRRVSDGAILEVGR
ncbi:hypothetical protein ACIHCQ_35115 [Streptomyces sp. NPDC052236]|uniref:hypothetical protein n=1 Tax=Streptomyces sp. NPDC052236 TaxID=3365686 RepID=UPI0037D89754